MNAYFAQTSVSVKLTFRDKTVLFFNYAFPLIFFFIFAQLFKAEHGGAIVQVDTMVLTIGVLGTGFFGGGVRAVQDREQNILRRFKVAPISAGPILIASLVTGLLTFLPSAVFILFLSHLLYGMPIPMRLLSLLVFLSVGVIAFRAIGLIIASVVNSMQESQIIIQLLYFPMLMLSGATIPLGILPKWVQVFAQFLPATYLITGMQGIFERNETIFENLSSIAALLLTAFLATFVSMKLFRWEKGEKIPQTSKLWVLAALAPFVVLGCYQSYSMESVTKAKILARQIQRARTLLIRNARIFVGNGQVIDSGAVLIKDGKIAGVFQGASPEPEQVKADVIEASGKTLLPGLIDMHVHLAASPGFSKTPQNDAAGPMQRALAAYLYSGVTAVKSVGDPLSAILKVRQQVNSGERLGAELFLCGPVFTAPGGHGTEYFKGLPQSLRKMAEQQAVRLPKTPEEARQQVDELKQAGVDGIKVILEAGQAGVLFERVDVGILNAVAAEARAQGLPVVAHTGDARDVADALAAGVNGIEHGSARELIPDELFAKMKAQGVAYDPTLSVIEVLTSLASGNLSVLDRSLVQQVTPATVLADTRKFLQSPEGLGMRAQIPKTGVRLDLAGQNLLRAWRAGVLLVAGSDSGNPLVFHGPAIHRELQLWVEAGIPAPVALQAATYNAARMLRADARIGLIATGHDATLLLVDGNPVQDIRTTENIQRVIFKAERISRPDLFDQE
jgi:imidazolonepropionase-like amidohydrolase/ABC-type multidrug transport system permease subunit